MEMVQPWRYEPLWGVVVILLGLLFPGANARADMLIPVLGNEQAEVEQVLGSAEKVCALLPDPGPYTVYRPHGDSDLADGEKEASMDGLNPFKVFGALAMILSFAPPPVYPETYNYHNYDHPVTSSFHHPDRKHHGPPDDPYQPPEPPFNTTPEPGSLVLALLGGGMLGLGSIMVKGKRQMLKGKRREESSSLCLLPFAFCPGC